MKSDAIPLRQVLWVKHGYAFKGDHFEASGDKLVLTPGNFAIGGGIQLRDGKERYYGGSYPEEFDLRAGDLLVAMTDLTQGAPILGSPIMIPADGRRYLHNQRLGKIEVDSERLDRRFAYYMFVWDGVRAQLRASATGATVRHTAPERIGRVLIDLPPLAAQRKVAAVLSAYDELIDNSRRRIRLLDEMAQRIYREWFLDLRYPGHEGIPIGESLIGPLPSSWSVARLDDVALVVDCLHSKKPARHASGPGLLVQLDNIRDDGLLDLSDRFLISAQDYERWTSRIELSEGDCVVTNVGRIGAVAQLPLGTRAAAGRNMTGVRPVRVTPTFLLQYLLSDHMKQEVERKKDAGAIMDSLNVKGIIRLAIPLPPSDLMHRFELTVRPIRREMENLLTATHLLRESRDLLLPRLVSGEVDVNDLDISVHEAAA